MELSTVDFDIDEFLNRVSGNKPPFHCPVEDCTTVWKSLASFRGHMGKHRSTHSVNDSDSDSLDDEDCLQDDEVNQSSDLQLSNSLKRRLPRSGSAGKDPTGDSRKFVMFDSRGRNYRYNVHLPVEICQISSTTNTEARTPSTPLDMNGSESSELPDLGDAPDTPQTVATGAKLSKKNSSKMGKQQNRLQGKPTLPKSGSGGEGKIPVPEPVYELNEDFPVVKKTLIIEEKGFVRFIEKSTDELDEIVEYDLDEEDLIWLEKYNEHRLSDKLPAIDQHTMELVLDRFEKSAHFRSSGGPDSLEHVDEDAACAVCNDGSCENSNAILFCDLCNLAVHQECYGVPYIPEGQWLCRKCIYSPSEPVKCTLCPNQGGAYKRTAEEEWAHVICALWVPEVIFANLTFLEPVENIKNIAPARWRLQCYICKQRNVGACIQCHKSSCYTAFHVTCAQQAGLYMKIENCYDQRQLGVKKSAFCDAHAPTDSGKIHNSMYAHSDNEQQDNGADFQRLHLRRARKILADRRNCTPSVCLPVIPSSKFQEILVKLDLKEKDEFGARIHAFWKLKRELRHGVPLLKRLQASSNRGAISFVACDEEAKRMRAQMKFWQRLRQDLEKARLLSELIRKRERIKRELFRLYAMTVELKIQPFVCFLRRIITDLQERDPDEIFAKPVLEEDVPGYSEVVTEPMDFSTLLKKVNAQEYSSLNQLEKDFKLMLSNCCLFNSKDTIYFKLAVKLKDYGLTVFKTARDLAHVIGFDEERCVHLDDLKEKIAVESKVDQDSCFLDEEMLQELSESERNSLTPTKQLEILLRKVEELVSSASFEEASIKSGKIRHLRGQIRSLRSRYQLKEGDSGVAVDHSPSPSVEAATVSGSGDAAATSSSVKRPRGRPPLQKNSNDKSKQLMLDSPSLLPMIKIPRKRRRSSTDSSAKSPARKMSRMTDPDSPLLAPPSLFLLTDEGSNQVPLPPPPTTNSLLPLQQETASTNPAFTLYRSRTHDIDDEESTSPPFPPQFSDSKSKQKSSSPAKSPARHRSPHKLQSRSRVTSPSSLYGLLAPSSSEASSSVAGDDDDEEGSSSEDGELHHQRVTAQPGDGEEAGGVALEPLDLVWAKCRGRPWIPGMLIDPEMPSDGYSQNGVPITAPSSEVLEEGEQCRSGLPLLVTLFDARRSWQWLSRDKLEPLGVDSGLDKEKLRSAVRTKWKAVVRKSYARAVEHLCKVNGRPFPFSDAISPSNSPIANTS